MPAFTIKTQPDDCWLLTDRLSSSCQTKLFNSLLTLCCHIKSIWTLDQNGLFVKYSAPVSVRLPSVRGDFTDRQARHSCAEYIPLLGADRVEPVATFFTDESGDSQASGISFYRSLGLEECRHPHEPFGGHRYTPTRRHRMEFGMQRCSVHCVSSTASSSARRTSQ